MLEKMVASAIVAGLLMSYVTMLYALVHLLVLLNRSYLLSIAI